MFSPTLEPMESSKFLKIKYLWSVEVTCSFRLYRVGSGLAFFETNTTKKSIKTGVMRGGVYQVNLSVPFSKKRV